MGDGVVSVDVDLPGRAYPIHIGPGLLRRLGERLRERCGASRATIVTDANVGPLYAEKLVGALEASGFESAVLTVPAGDGTKSLRQVGLLYDDLAKRQHGRMEPVIALGGGMVGDLAGFVAATWLRGVPLVQCPTTVVADVDAGVGGKTAVNHPAGKNLIGAFHQPLLVCVDTDCLATLGGRDFCAGLAESVKHAVIRDEDFFDWQEAHAGEILAQDSPAVGELIRRNCENKAAVVAADERETQARGVGRAALNFGHTIGHAIEAQSRYELRHGEAVSLGMVAAMELAVTHCGFSDEERARVESLLAAFRLPVRAPRPIDVADILGRLGVDKKVRDRVVRFVLPTRIGAVRWPASPPIEDVKRAVERLVAP
ncbi:MAG: 3-dehydroquinate synthase [Phycisphaerae bacterium]|nr:3-dehydroquinate synthase [Phycisphaerae bacterium]